MATPPSCVATRRTATQLGGIAIAAALERADVAPEQVEHVVMGQVLQAGVGQSPRQAQIQAGIPKEVSSETIDKVCASGVRAAGGSDAAIRASDVDVAVAGGMESMSQAPYGLPQARFGAPDGGHAGARRDGPQQRIRSGQAEMSSRRRRSRTSSR